MFDSFPTNLLVYLAVAFAIIHTIRRKARSRYPLPPGPAQLPLIGNALQLANIEILHEGFGKLAQEHGDVIHLEAFGQHIVVLDSLAAATDLLMNRSLTYSDRPPCHMLSDLSGWAEWEFGMMNGPEWRQHRGLFNQYFNRTAVRQYSSLHCAETLQSLLMLLHTPEDFRQHIKHLAGASIMRIVYGIRIKRSNDPYVAIAEEAIKALIQSTIPGAFLVDFFPILKHVPPWMPGSGFKRTAAHWKEAARRLVHVPFKFAKQNIVDGSHPDSVTASLLQAGDGTAEYERLVENVAAMAYLGGADTSTSSMSMFFLAMALHPEVQLKALAELEAVVSKDRLPTFEDRPHLPYINAIVKETLRWYPVLYLGSPHMSNADDEYRGYFIPRGTTLIPNFWSMLRNEKDYPNPSEFRPERFLKDGKLNPNVLDPAQIVFGFGRRKCPGRYFADNGIFIFVASVLACFSIEPAKDENGQAIPIKAVMSQGLISYPEPFKCKITPRSGAIEDLIRRTLGDYGEKDATFDVPE